MRGCGGIVVCFCSKQQHADEGGETDDAHGNGQSFARTLVVAAALALVLRDAGALSGVVEFVAAFGDCGSVSSHGFDGKGRGFDGFCGRFDGRPAGRIGTGSGGLVDVAGHVHLEVEARGGSAAMEVNLAGSDGHSHGLAKVSKRGRARAKVRDIKWSLTGPSEPQMSE